MYRNHSASSWNYTGPKLNPEVQPFHRSLPDYSITPLVPLPDVSQQLEVAHVLLKDESHRLGLPAFKILGASWAVFKAVAEECNLPLASALHEVGKAAKEKGIRLVTCTEGNWGRAVSRMAKYLDITAIIFVPDFMDEATQEKIRSEGAEVVVVDGDYDYSIQKARAEAGRGGLLVMDVSWEGYDMIPEVMMMMRLYDVFGESVLADMGSGWLKGTLRCCWRQMCSSNRWVSKGLHMLSRQLA